MTLLPTKPRLMKLRLKPRASAWALLPEDLSSRGYRASASHLFGRVHRVWTWALGGPDVGRDARAFLDAEVDLALPEIVERRASVDGSTKVVLGLRDGLRVEAVHMPRAVRSPRVTLCISSQVGCAMGCTFCATATMGLVRNLDAGEIVGQVVSILRAFAPMTTREVTLVFMGMGEPLHNTDHVLRALRVMCHPQGLGIAPSRITVSTSGIVPGIDKLARATPRPLLALSLNATTDAARTRTMPVTKTWGLAALRDALARWPLRPREKVTLEYVLLAGENDTLDDADRLASFASGLRHNVNVIPYNEYEASPFREPKEERVQAFVKRLQERDCLVTVRRSRGRDVQAACGLLAK